MNYTSITITKKSDRVWEITDNTTSGEGHFQDAWRGSSSGNLVSIKSVNGLVVYTNQSYSVFSYVDELDSGNDLSDPSSAIELMTHLTNQDFFYKGDTGGVPNISFLELVDVLIDNYFGRENQVIQVNNSGTGLTSSTPSFAFQNNIGKRQNIIRSGDMWINTVGMANYVNDNVTISVTETNTPVILHVQNTKDGLTTVYVYLFFAGKGVWGNGGAETTSGHFYYITERITSPQDLEDTPNSVFFDLGDTTGQDFWDVANLQDPPFDLTDSGEVDENGFAKTYYFSYTDDGVLYYAQFVGTPGYYGVDENQFVEGDFVVTTNDTITQAISFHETLLVNPVTTLIARFRDLSREIQVGGGKISRVQSGGPNRTDLVWENPTAINTQTFQDKSGVIALLSDILGLDLSTVTANGNTTLDSIGIGVSASPLAHLHVGSINATRSSNPHILLAELIDDASGSGNAHGFADSSIFNRIGIVSYAAFDGRFILNGDTYNHIVSFQHDPLINITGSIDKVYGTYTAGILQAGTVDDFYGHYVANPVVTGGIINKNYGLYVAELTAGTTNWSIYTHSSPVMFRGDLNLWKVDGAVGSGAILRFNSGTSGNGTPEAIITQEIMSSSRGDIVFKVRTASTAGDAGLTEGFRYQGGAVRTLAITGKATVSVAPTNPTDVVRKTELDLKAPLSSPALTGIPTAPTAADGTATTQIATTLFVENAIKAREVIDDTTVALTASDLNTEYAGVPILYKVYCPDITPLGAVYVKMTVGGQWMDVVTGTVLNP